MLERGVDIFTSDRDSQTPLTSACQRGYKDIVRLLLERGAEVDPPYWLAENPNLTALATACVRGFEDVVRLLLDSGADPDCLDSRWGSALVAAAKEDSCPIVRMLCEAGADVNLKIDSCSSEYDYPNALSAAADLGHKDVVQILLTFGADFNLWSGNGEYGTALVAAAKRGHIEIMSLLLESGADVNLGSVNCEYTSALVAATGEGHEAAVQLLLKKGANLDDQDLNDHETLAAAIELGNIELVQAIIDWGVDVQAKDSHGWTLYDIAYANEYKSICDLLAVETPSYADQDQVSSFI